MVDFDAPEGGLLVLLFLILAGAITAVILFLLALQKAFLAITEENRQMPAGQVWLLLIPLFNLIWMFVVVIRLADSFRLEFARLNINYGEERPTYGIGLTLSIINASALVIPDEIAPALNTLVSLAGFVCWIVYWIRVVQCRRLVEANRDNDLLDAERGIFHNNQQL